MGHMQGLHDFFINAIIEIIIQSFFFFSNCDEQVVIVGPEGVGKTYLSRRLMGEEYNINLSTDGIAVSHQSLKSPTMNRQVNFASTLMCRHYMLVVF